MYSLSDARRLTRSASFYIAYFLDNHRILSYQAMGSGRAGQLDPACLTDRILNFIVATALDLHTGDTPVRLPRMQPQL